MECWRPLFVGDHKPLFFAPRQICFDLPALDVLAHTEVVVRRQGVCLALIGPHGKHLSGLPL